MKDMINKISKGRLIGLSLIICHLSLSVALTSCSDPNEDSLFVTPTTEETQMPAADILERDADQYSLWIRMLKHANYYNALKDASTTATVFCPDNAAVQSFLDKKGYASVEAIPENYAKSVVRVHIIKKDYTEAQVDSFANWGKTNAERGYEMPDTTLLGTNLTFRYGYIETDVDDVDRHDENVFVADSIYINNQARLDKFTAITCSNGVLFSMGDVIEPLVETIMDKLDAADNYTIFAAAVHDCGYDETASLTTTTTYTISGPVTTTYNFTCLAVPDDVYHAAGINDVAGLKSYLASHSEKAEDADLLNYVKYHFLPRSYTKAELLSYESDDPEAEEEVLIYDTNNTGQAITVKRVGGTDYINNDIPLVRTNLQTRNGIIHKVDDVMPVFHPAPVRVVWDFLNSADIISVVNSYGLDKGLGNIFSTPVETSMRDVDLSDDHFDGNYGEITSFTYQANESKAKTNTYRRVGYKKDAKGTAANGSQYGAYMNNFMILNLGYAGWIQFTTPTIIAGKYKVVLHYCKDINHNNFINSGTLTRFEIDDNKSNIYLYKGMTRLPRYQKNEATIFGALTFEGSGNHTFKITMLDVEAKNNSNYHQSLDYVEFIPIN